MVYNISLASSKTNSNLFFLTTISSLLPFYFYVPKSLFQKPPVVSFNNTSKKSLTSDSFYTIIKLYNISRLIATINFILQ